MACQWAVLERQQLMVVERVWPAMQHKWDLSEALRSSSSSNYIKDTMGG